MKPMTLSSAPPDFQILFETAPASFLVLTPDLTIVAVSDAYLRDTMTTREHLLGRPLFEAFPMNPDDPAANGMENLYASLQRVIAQGVPDVMAVQQYDIRRPASTGGGFEVRYWSPVNTPVFDADRRLRYIIHRVEDVTEYMLLTQQEHAQRRETEELRTRTHQMEAEIYARAQELQMANQQLRAANAALQTLDQAKTAFFQNISHEFRTPLTLLIGPVADSLTDREEPLPPGQRERLEIVQRNATRLLRLVTTLLDFTRLESGRFQAEFRPTDLAALTQSLASQFASAATEAKLELRVECSSTTAPIYIDSRLWEHVIINLLANALKYTWQGEISVTLYGEGGCAVLAVRDTGVGIPPEALPHLFERFYRVPEAPGRTHEGTGIGLAMVHEIVQLHGGTIDVESAVGRGSCFTVRIPTGMAHLPAEQIYENGWEDASPSHMAAALAEIAGWQPARPLPHALGKVIDKPHILLAEDNGDMRHYISRLLQPHYLVQVAENGAKALEALQATTPDLILSDVMMPELDGFGLLQDVRANPKTRTIPFILLSARAGEEPTIEGLDAGADDYMIKPFSARELLSRIAAHLELVRLRRDEASLRETNRRLNEFLIIASHELRTPLTAVQGNLQLIESFWHSQMPTESGLIASSHVEEMREMLRDAEAGTQQLARLIGAMLDTSRIDGGQLQLALVPSDLVALVRETVNEMQLAWPERTITLACSQERPLGVLMARERIGQALANLLSNAHKYSPAQAPIHVTVTRKGNKACVAVQDHGPGVPEEEQQHVWERFYRVPGVPVENSSTIGLGIGLYLCREIIARHGGETGLDSRPGHGSTFWFTLPVQG